MKCSEFVFKFNQCCGNCKANEGDVLGLEKSKASEFFHLVLKNYLLGNKFYYNIICYMFTFINKIT